MSLIEKTAAYTCSDGKSFFNLEEAQQHEFYVQLNKMVEDDTTRKEHSHAPAHEIDPRLEGVTFLLPEAVAYLAMNLTTIKNIINALEKS